MKVAVYIRVSTDEQAQEGYSIPAQRNRLEAYALSQGWEIAQYYVDEGISAKDLNRPELKRLLKGVEAGLFDCVLVYRLDRLTRSVLDLYKLLNQFEKHNVKFKSATEVYDTTTAIGRLFITLVAALAQWERENLGERVRMGMQQKAREGKWTVSTPPIGYDSVDSDLVINQTEAALVKEIYAQYLSGIGMWRIARSLNERRLFGKRNKPWNQATINYILTNPIYIGKSRYNYRVNTENYFEVENMAPPIVAEEEFNTVQQMIKSRSFAHPRQATSRYLFSKVLKCARCGTTLIGKSSQSKRGDKTYSSYNYYCPGRQRGVCDMPMVNENLMEQKFLKEIESWDLSDTANEMESNKTDAINEDLKETEQEIEKELKELEDRRAQWQYAWVKKMISDVDLTRRLKEEEEKEKLLMQQLAEITKHEQPSELNTELLTDLRLNWKHMATEAKKQFILIAVDRIVVDKISKDRTPGSIEIKEFRTN